MKAKMFFLFAAIATSGVFFTSCGNNADKTEDTEAVNAVDSMAQQAAPAAEIMLTPFPASTEFANAALSFSYEKGNFTVKTTGYELKQQTPDAPQKMCANSKDGQHVHIIVDDGPYDAVYASPFEKAIPDGPHYVLGFLGRSYHESIKTKALATPSKSK